MQYIKQAARDKANDYLVGQFEKSRQLLMNEFRHIQHESNIIQKENNKYISMLNVANDKIERQEVVISELNSYIKWMHNFLASMDKDLGILNDGPAQIGGPVVDALESFDKFLHDPTQKTKRARLLNLTEKFFDKPLSFYS